MKVSLISISIMSVVGLILFVILLKLIGIIVIGSNEVGIIEKWWSTRGSVKSGFIALNGEAGYQPDMIRAGIHIKPLFIYKVSKQPLITIPRGQMAYVFSRDGKTLAASQLLGFDVESNSFQDARAFLTNGGFKGPQVGYLKDGTYAINTALFIVLTADRTYGIRLGSSKEELQMLEAMKKDIETRNGFSPVVIAAENDVLAIVNTNMGKPLSNGDIIAPIIGNNPDEPNNFHNNFQNVNNFIVSGGYMGKQLQVLTDGTYFINRLFATIKFVPKVQIPIGTVGVVTSFAGDKGLDVSGDDYKHGELVETGKRGVWKDALGVGKYAVNTDACAVALVPTANTMLKWSAQESGTHYDENLKEISFLTKDGFEVQSTLTVVVHVDRLKASRIIQRFGDMVKLFEQSIDPLISAYFKNVGQTKTLIELNQFRDAIQKEATDAMRIQFREYDLELVSILIGNPESANKGDNSVETMYEQLRSRQLAKEQIITYQSQQESKEKEKELNEAAAVALQQKSLTESKINIEIEKNKGQADATRATQEAAKIETIATANANATKLTAAAQAFKITQEGLAQSIATEANVAAYGGPQLLLTKEVMGIIGDAIAKSGSPIVPSQMVVFGGGGHEGDEQSSFPNAIESLVKTALVKNLGIDMGMVKDHSKHSENIENMKKEILNKMTAEVKAESGADAKVVATPEPLVEPKVETKAEPKVETKVEPQA
jgi:uncharacterized membrane protein YqiK